ncbi:MAG: hypothetical protein VKO39_13155 [Cyanobacteriota bacterium]|nr:hypothetical protein [Cyanobacteriota bacterium]
MTTLQTSRLNNIYEFKPHVTTFLLATSTLTSCFLAGAPQASALTVIDNIGVSPFPSGTNSRALSSTNWAAKSFSSSTAPGNTISSLTLPLAIGSATSASRTLNIQLYAATNTGTPTVNSDPNAFRPAGSLLASTSYTANFSNAGNTTQNPSGGYTILGFPELGSIASYALQPSTNYSLVFSTAASTLSWRIMNSAYNSSYSFNFLNSTGTTSGTSFNPITITGSWQNPTLTNLATNGLTIDVVPGPLPLLGVGVFFRMSRNLRHRVKTAQLS